MSVIASWTLFPLQYKISFLSCLNAFYLEFYCMWYSYCLILIVFEYVFYFFLILFFILEFVWYIIFSLYFWTFLYLFFLKILLSSGQDGRVGRHYARLLLCPHWNYHWTVELSTWRTTWRLPEVETGEAKVKHKDDIIYADCLLRVTPRHLEDLGTEKTSRVPPPICISKQNPYWT